MTLKKSLLIQTAELIENLLIDKRLSSFHPHNKDKLETVWQNINEQLEVLFFEIWLTPDQPFYQQDDQKRLFMDGH